MQTQEIATRLKQKHALEAEWLSVPEFVPLEGEFIIYTSEIAEDGTVLQLPDGRTTPYDYARFKIGDGHTKLADLKFSNKDLASEEVFARNINVAHLAVGDIVGVAVPESAEDIIPTGFASTSSILAGYGKTAEDILAAGQHGFNIKSIAQSGTVVTITLQPNGDDNVDKFTTEVAKLKPGMSVYIPTAHSRDSSKPAFRPGVTQYQIISVSTTDYTITIQIPDGKRAIGYNGLISDWNISGATATKCTESSLEGSWQNVPVVLTKRIDYKLYSTDCPDAGTTVISRGALSHGYKTRAVGDGSYAQGRETATLGDYSHAEGRSNTVYVENGHAEGAHTAVAPNKFFDANGHAEGAYTTARMEAAHAEGQSSTSVYSYLDAETIRQDEGGSKILQAWNDSGKQFLMANGRGAHAEGNNTLANANTAHAEGFQTLANKEHTHAEGEGTIADSKHQHVQGKYNVADNKNTYAHIIGGGTSDSDRKNIHTIDWSGNANFEGGIDSKQGITVGQNLRNVNYSKGSFSAMFGNSSRYADNGLIPTFLAHQWDSQAAASMRADWLAASENPNDRFSFVFGNGAFACGRNTVALGTSHAEGACTLALKDGAHSEGYETIAQGSYSHAEGQGTIALGSWQHVQGKFNEENADYAHIVGAGSSNTSRKNIHTLSWSGNAWYAGEVTATKFNGDVSATAISSNTITASGKVDANVVKTKSIISYDGSWDDEYASGGTGTPVVINGGASVSSDGHIFRVGGFSVDGHTGAADVYAQADGRVTANDNLYFETNDGYIYLNDRCRIDKSGYAMDLDSNSLILHGSSGVGEISSGLGMKINSAYGNNIVINDFITIENTRPRMTWGQNEVIIEGNTGKGYIRASTQLFLNDNVVISEDGKTLTVENLKIGNSVLNAAKLEKLLKFIDTFEFDA